MVSNFSSLECSSSSEDITTSKPAIKVLIKFRSVLPTLSSSLLGVDELELSKQVPAHKMEENPRIIGGKRIYPDEFSSGSSLFGEPKRTEDTFIREDEDGIRSHYCPLVSNFDRITHDKYCSDSETENEFDNTSSFYWKEVETDSCQPSVSELKPPSSESEDSSKESVNYAPLENQPTTKEDSPVVSPNRIVQLLEFTERTPLDKETMESWLEDSSDDFDDFLVKDPELPPRHTIGNESDMEEFEKDSESETENEGFETTEDKNRGHKKDEGSKDFLIESRNDAESESSTESSNKLPKSEFSERKTTEENGLSSNLNNTGDNKSHKEKSDKKSENNPITQNCTDEQKMEWVAEAEKTSYSSEHDVPGDFPSKSRLEMSTKPKKEENKIKDLFERNISEFTKKSQTQPHRQDILRLDINEAFCVSHSSDMEELEKDSESETENDGFETTEDNNRGHKKDEGSKDFLIESRNDTESESSTESSNKLPKSAYSERKRTEENGLSSNLNNTGDNKSEKEKCDVKSEANPITQDCIDEQKTDWVAEAEKTSYSSEHDVPDDFPSKSQLEMSTKSKTEENKIKDLFERNNSEFRNKSQTQSHCQDILRLDVNEAFCVSPSGDMEEFEKDSKSETENEGFETTEDKNRSHKKDERSKDFVIESRNDTESKSSTESSNKRLKNEFSERKSTEENGHSSNLNNMGDNKSHIEKCDIKSETNSITQDCIDEQKTDWVAEAEKTSYNTEHGVPDDFPSKIQLEMSTKPNKEENKDKDLFERNISEFRKKSQTPPHRQDILRLDINEAFFVSYSNDMEEFEKDSESETENEGFETTEDKNRSHKKNEGSKDFLIELRNDTESKSITESSNKLFTSEHSERKSIDENGYSSNLNNTGDNKSHKEKCGKKSETNTITQHCIDEQKTEWVEKTRYSSEHDVRDDFPSKSQLEMSTKPTKEENKIKDLFERNISEFRKKSQTPPHRQEILLLNINKAFFVSYSSDMEEFEKDSESETENEGFETTEDKTRGHKKYDGSKDFLIESRSDTESESSTESSNKLPKSAYSERKSTEENGLSSNLNNTGDNKSDKEKCDIKSEANPITQDCTDEQKTEVAEAEKTSYSSNHDVPDDFPSKSQLEMSTKPKKEENKIKDLFERKISKFRMKSQTPPHQLFAEFIDPFMKNKLNDLSLTLVRLSEKARSRINLKSSNYPGKDESRENRLTTNENSPVSSPNHRLSQLAERTSSLDKATTELLENSSDKFDDLELIPRDNIGNESNTEEFSKMEIKTGSPKTTEDTNEGDKKDEGNKDLLMNAKSLRNDPENESNTGSSDKSTNSCENGHPSNINTPDNNESQSEKFDELSKTIATALGFNDEQKMEGVSKTDKISDDTEHDVLDDLSLKRQIEMSTRPKNEEKKIEDPFESNISESKKKSQTQADNGDKLYHEMSTERKVTYEKHSMEREIVSDELTLTQSVLKPDNRSGVCEPLLIEEQSVHSKARNRLAKFVQSFKKKFEKNKKA